MVVVMTSELYRLDSARGVLGCVFEVFEHRLPGMRTAGGTWHGLKQVFHEYLASCLFM